MSQPLPFESGPGQGYHVYPDKLRAAADAIDQAADLLRAFALTDLADVRLAQADLGLPGTLTQLMRGVQGAGTVDAYNRAVDQVREISVSNSAELGELSAALHRAAEHYERLDRHAYDELKKLEGGIR
ncbi:hypothetical protein [Amycolatopsis alba]|uniref:ESX-1 secretion-associated protein n=1 Tax=Amycolatopsis alba DSM 44262 TaxID=1125972 RepID=A0A229RPY3_AMYAL|nr:hypothetical protein [Amycolatopsis alba]OXM48703.1 hypothetical protein CFP75_20925 [Amycolatopsis alba DSM 44262]